MSAMVRLILGAIVFYLAVSSVAVWAQLTDSTKSPVYYVYRGNAEIKQGKKKNKVQYRIHFAPDSLLWFSVTGGGIEGARGLARVDSFFLLNRLEDKFTTGAVMGLGRLVGLEVDFKQLVALLVGETPWVDTTQLPLKLTAKSITYQWSAGNVLYTLTQAREGRKLQLLQLSKASANFQATLKMDDYQAVGLSQTPFVVNFSVKDGESPLSITLRHKRVELVYEAPTFKFVVPAGFRREVR